MVLLPKISFGGASAIVTSLGLIVGFAAAHTPRPTVMTGLLIFALADNLTDALSIHIYQESERLEGRRALEATIGNFMTRLGICGTFVLFVGALPEAYAVGASLVWGTALLSGLTWLVARNRGANASAEICKHLAVALAVIVVSRAIGTAILGLSFAEL
ncbi:MAG TPA: hypothetical protein VMQ11_19990 [Alphaproteobacteria bacterium]|nr:hypothetical protein [Alphaproteobacteria bacterium]